LQEQLHEQLHELMQEQWSRQVLSQPQPPQPHTVGASRTAAAAAAAGIAPETESDDDEVAARLRPAAELVTPAHRQPPAQPLSDGTRRQLSAGVEGVGDAPAPTGRAARGDAAQAAGVVRLACPTDTSDANDMCKGCPKCAKKIPAGAYRGAVDRAASPSAARTAAAVGIAPETEIDDEEEAYTTPTAREDAPSGTAAAAAMPRIVEFFEEKKLTMSDLFAQLDADGSGSLDPAELRHFLHSLGLELAPNAAEEVVSALDVDGAGFVPLSEFVPRLRAVKESAPLE
jgi:hypothetical protein